MHGWIMGSSYTSFGVTRGMPNCPSCGTSDAYLGLTKIECSNSTCQHFKAPAVVTPVEVPFSVLSGGGWPSGCFEYIYGRPKHGTSSFCGLSTLFPEPEPYSTGFYALDEALDGGIRPGYLHVIYGKIGTGYDLLSKRIEGRMREQGFHVKAFEHPGDEGGHGDFHERRVVFVHYASRPGSIAQKMQELAQTYDIPVVMCNQATRFGHVKDPRILRSASVVIQTLRSNPGSSTLRVTIKKNRFKGPFHGSFDVKVP
jgi:hypothetical protein